MIGFLGLFAFCRGWYRIESPLGIRAPGVMVEPTWAADRGSGPLRLSTDFRASHPPVEWADIVGFRNIAVHEYLAVSWSIV